MSFVIVIEPTCASKIIHKVTLSSYNCAVFEATYSHTPYGPVMALL